MVYLIKILLSMSFNRIVSNPCQRALKCVRLDILIRKNMFSKTNILTLFKIFAKRLPSPQTELVYTNDFTLLVAVVLSAQSTDTGVNKATKDLFAKADTPAKMAQLGVDTIRHFIRTIGLTQTKAKNVHALSILLCERFNSTVPNTREDLESLPGVGRKTANVVLNVAFGMPTMAVDTHIFRVSNRLGLTSAKNPRESEKQLLSAIPRDYLTRAHHWLILHGRYICKARKPACEQCPFTAMCLFYQQNNPTNQ